MNENDVVETAAAVRESKPRTPPQSATEIPAPRYSTSAALKNKQAQVIFRIFFSFFCSCLHAKQQLIFFIVFIFEKKVQYTPTASFADVIIDGN